MSNEAKVFIAEKSVRKTTATEKKKTVYKHVFDSPFVLKWPKVHSDLGATILTELLKVLEPIGQYRKKLRTLKKEKKQIGTAEKPEILSRLHVGINDVTQSLETWIQNKQLPSDTTPVIYICKREFKPQMLCQHLLSMAALAHVQLVVLPANAECQIGKALNISRASVVLLEIMENKEETLRLIAKDIPFVDTPWSQNPLLNPPPFIRESVKILQTVAPTPKTKDQKIEEKKIKYENKQKQVQQTNKRKGDPSPQNKINKKIKK